MKKFNKNFKAETTRSPFSLNIFKECICPNQLTDSVHSKTESEKIKLDNIGVDITTKYKDSPTKKVSIMLPRDEEKQIELFNINIDDNLKNRPIRSEMRQHTLKSNLKRSSNKTEEASKHQTEFSVFKLTKDNSSNANR
jgi:hypothetical protein